MGGFWHLTQPVKRGGSFLQAQYGGVLCNICVLYKWPHALSRVQ